MDRADALALEPSGERGLEERLWPSPEQRLLLQAALFDGPRARDAFTAWRQGVDLDDDFSWSVLRLLPAVHENLRAAGYDDPLMGRLKGVYRRAWYESQQLFHQVLPVARGLKERGVDVMVLKGAALLLSYYRQHGLRPMADIDLWVPQAQLPVALAFLRESGWTFGVAPDPDHVRFHHAVQCFGPDGGELDLHWHVFWERSRNDFDANILSLSEPIDFLGTPLRQLDPTTLLLHVVTHGIRWNRETPIRWIPDAMRVLRQRGADIDWDRLVAMAREARATYRTRLGLRYLVDEFEAPVPALALEALRATPTTLLERIDNTVVLHDDAEFEGSAVRQQWRTFTEFCRRTDASGPYSFAVSFTHFLRYRWHLNGRREIPVRIWRGIRRRVGGAGSVQAGSR